MISEDFPLDDLLEFIDSFAKVSGNGVNHCHSILEHSLFKL